MPPTTTRTRITPAGASARNSIREVRQNVNLGATPEEARATLGQIKAGPTTGFKVDLPKTIPSTTLQSDQTLSDVFARRNEMAQEQGAATQFDTDFNNLMGRVQAPIKATPFQNPQQFIEETLLRRSTDTQNSLDEARLGQADILRSTARDLTKTRENAVEQFGLPDLQANLAETRNRIAERTNQLRTTLRDFETNAERRGVAREFVESERGKVQADAAAELADLAIIESAQAGNVQMAQEDIDRAVNAKIQAFEFENAAIEAEIKRLEGIDTRESQARSEQLTIALQERTRNIEKSIADEKQKLTYLSEAAANGADQGTLDAIRKATNVGEAALMAGPYIGRLDRQVQQANLANIYSQISDRATRLQLAQEAALLDQAAADAIGLTENEAKSEKALGMFKMLEELAIHPGFNDYVGPNPIVRGFSPFGVGSMVLTGSRSEFASLVDKIANTLTLDNMDKLRGPATDKDVELVAASVSTLKNNDVSETAYRDEIRKISDAMKRIAINNGVTAEQLQFYGLADENTISEFDQVFGTSNSTIGISTQ